jgi:hypothetical protein
MSANLTMQGFACDSDPRVKIAGRWLRFTPAMSFIFLTIGTLLRSPVTLWAFAVVAIAGAVGWHAFDALFNGAVRHLFGAKPLPPNPAPRRFAMAAASAWAATSGVLMTTRWALAGVLSAAVLTGLAALVATTDFCVGSWMYGLLWREARA